MTARKSFAGSLLELLLIVAAAGGLALLIQAFVIKPYRIPTGSMEPTLKIGQRVLVDRLGLHFLTLHVGDIIVFHPARDYQTCVASNQGEPSSGTDPTQPCDVAQATDNSTVFIKRVVGLPGDRLQIVNGHVIRNGVREKDSYTVPCGGAPACTFPGTIVVPNGDYYVLGDNRPDSEDSRFWGPVRRSWIIGKAFFTYWPPDRLGFL